jgi:uncharacterized membrane protein YqaE (UPF0057 family)
MRYLFAIVFPPLALLLCGKWFQAILAFVLQITLIGWIPASIWALFVVQSHLADLRNERLIAALARKLPRGKY